MKSFIVPYMYIDGVPTFKNSDIMKLFDRMKSDGTLSITFFDGVIRTRKQFLSYMRQLGIYLYVCYIKGDVNPMGFVWLSDFGHKTAHGHFCIFREYWHDAYHIGHEILVTLITMKDREGNYVLDAIYGITPTSNKPAIRAITNAGMKIVGTLPYRAWNDSKGKSEDAILSYFTRSEISNESL